MYFKGHGREGKHNLYGDNGVEKYLNGMKCSKNRTEKDMLRTYYS
jgi:hypothetical protein